MEKMILSGSDPKQAITPKGIDDVFKLANIAAKTGMFGVKSSDEAAVRIITGMELGLSPYQALRGIHVLNGRPVLAADLMVAVCLSSDRCEYFSLIESTDAIATYETKRRGGQATKLSWTMEQAKKAGLAGRGTWAAHPAAMLRARCSAALARVAFPDLINGLYDPDEAQDAAPSTEPTRVEAVVAETVYVADTQETLDQYRSKIDACQTTADLRALGAEIGKLDTKAKEVIKPLYLERMSALKAPNATA